MPDFQTAIGAQLPQGTVPMTVFIPSKDREGHLVDQEFWVDECLRTLGTLYRGGTAFPPGRGVWRDDERAGHLLFEPVVMVVTYASPTDLTDDSLARLRAFLHRLGRSAAQGEVGLVVDGVYYRINRFDPEPTP